MALIKYNRIAPVMVEADIKNETLARKLNVAEETISKWRKNKMQPSLPRLYEIAEFLEVDICTLLVSSSKVKEAKAAEAKKTDSAADGQIT